MKNNWKKVKLGDFAEIIMGQSPKSEFYTDNFLDVPFFQGCTEFGEIYPVPKKFCSRPTKIAEAKDVLMTVRAPVGDLNIATDKCCIGRGVCALRPKNNNTRFLFYLLKANKAYILNFENGAVYGSVNKDTIENFEFNIPQETETQQKIASVLSAYDDLIENNNRRIKILEETAQAIYNEWFVNFNVLAEVLTKAGFPNGKLKIKNGIPEGWEEKKIGEVVDNIKQKYIDEKHEGLPLLDLGRIPRKSLSISEYGPSDEIKTARKIFNEDDILFGNIRVYFHKVVFGMKKGITNSSVFVLRSKNKEYQNFFLNYFFSEDMILWASQNSGGTKMPVIGWEVLKKKEIMLPNKKIIKNYNNKTNSLLVLIKNLNLQNENLRKTRDLLLPKLMSGEIEIK